MGGKIADNTHELRFVNGDEAVQGIYQHRFHDVTAAHGVADGGKLVDVPDIPLEQPAGAHDKILVHHLAAGKETSLHMIHNLVLVDGRKLHVLHHPAEQSAALEERLHGIDAGAAEHKREEPSCLFLPQDGIQRAQDNIRIVQIAKALKFVQNHNHAVSPVRRHAERQAQHGQYILSIQFPIQGNHLIMFRIGNRVEHEVRPRQVPLHQVPDFVGGESHHLEHRGTQAQQEVFRRADIQGRKLPHRKGPAPQPHGVQCLLDERSFPGLGRFIDSHVLPLGKQVSQESHVCLPANEMLAGYILGVWKRCIHYSAAGTSSAAGSSASAGASSATGASSTASTVSL